MTCGNKSCAAKLYHKNIKNDPEKKRARSERQTQITKQLWTNKRESMLLGIRKWHKTEEARECYKQIAKNNVLNAERSRKISNKTKEQWNNLESREKLLAGVIKGMSNLASSKMPNYMESRLLCLLNSLYQEDFKYVGNFSRWISNKNPDFISESKKKIIELYGYTWHKDDTEEKTNERIALFKKEGYDTLIIWSYEMKDVDKLKNNIEDFINGRS